MTTQTDILSRLKTAGERITTPRRAVIGALCDLGGHRTIQEILHYLEAKTHTPLQEPTVYRVLQWLKDQEIVAQTDLGQSGTTYELLSEPRHHHMVCLNCGRVMDFDDAAVAPLRDDLLQQYGFTARIDHLAIFGLCERCRDGGDEF